MFGQNLILFKFWLVSNSFSKFIFVIKILNQNKNFGHKSKFLTQIKNVVKNLGSPRNGVNWVFEIRKIISYFSEFDQFRVWIFVNIRPLRWPLFQIGLPTVPLVFILALFGSQPKGIEIFTGVLTNGNTYNSLCSSLTKTFCMVPFSCVFP